MATFFENSVNQEYWVKRWEEGTSYWHKEFVEPLLEKHFHCLVPVTEVTGCSVFVTLCGKTVDMKWMAEQGASVVGCDLSEIAAEQFFSENNIPYKKYSIDNFSVFESTSNAYQIKLLVGSIYNCTKENTGGPFDLIWDCNALVAINPEDREKYISTHNSLLKPSGHILLSTYEYAEAFRAQAIARPPHTLPPDVVKTMYERVKLHVNLAESIDYSERFQIRFNIPQTVRHLFYISK